MIRPHVRPIADPTNKQSSTRSHFLSPVLSVRKLNTAAHRTYAPTKDLMLLNPNGTSGFIANLSATAMGLIIIRSQANVMTPQIKPIKTLKAFSIIPSFDGLHEDI
jgi:hypothetical protein